MKEIPAKLVAVDYINGITYIGLSTSSLQQNTAVLFLEYTSIPTCDVARQEKNQREFLKDYFDKKGIRV